MGGYLLLWVFSIGITKLTEAVFRVKNWAETFALEALANFEVKRCLWIEIVTLAHVAIKPPPWMEPWAALPGPDPALSQGSPAVCAQAHPSLPTCAVLQPRCVQPHIWLIPALTLDISPTLGLSPCWGRHFPCLQFQLPFPYVASAATPWEVSLSSLLWRLNRINSIPILCKTIEPARHSLILFFFFPFFLWMTLWNLHYAVRMDLSAEGHPGLLPMD